MDESSLVNDKILPIGLFILSCLALKACTNYNQNSKNIYQFYTGSCHCGKVKFRVKANRHLIVYQCNCSICSMKKNYHFIVPSVNFKLESGSDEYLSVYQFNSKVAKHTFCAVCGVQAFYHPRSNPDGVAVTLACISPSEIISYEFQEFDGVNWERSYNISNIKQHSLS